MDISGVSAAGAVSAVLAQQQVYTQEQAGVSMLKKSLDMQSQNALTLIQSIPQASSTQGLPPNLGNNINTTA
ncbi:YjfB family protein [Thiomicrorhabdus heinhorstiae]|uniref:YjfB family protein n=1 Tax=Thiomicrorhabdus heinhorstiae TaxID=2748010 RepID=A0ABS0BUG0_9GAMM|nr:YjfB family protein [Thiomicrorhabdus heinhorstiae]MBF6057477.1 YjfB family protein [Thiomicrorhabdus heinhorstiae]